MVVPYQARFGEWRSGPWAEGPACGHPSILIRHARIWSHGPAGGGSHQNEGDPNLRDRKPTRVGDPHDERFRKRASHDCDLGVALKGGESGGLIFGGQRQIARVAC